MTPNQFYTGGTFVRTEDGVALNVLPMAGNIYLPNGARVQVKRAFATAASNNTTELVPAIADKVIRVLSMLLLGGAVAPTVTFKSGTTAISPAFTHAANGGHLMPPNVWGWFQTLEMNQALNVTVSNSSDVGVIINYIEIPDDLFDLL